MTGFCSCKTGIHAILGNNLAALTHPCATRHRDIVTNGRNASSECSTSHQADHNTMIVI